MDAVDLRVAIDEEGGALLAQVGSIQERRSCVGALAVDGFIVVRDPFRSIDR